MLTSSAVKSFFLSVIMIYCIIKANYFDLVSFADFPQQLPWMVLQVQSDVIHYWILDFTNLVPGCNSTYTLPSSIDYSQGVNYLETDLYESGKFLYVNPLQSPFKGPAVIFVDLIKSFYLIGFLSYKWVLLD